MLPKTIAFPLLCLLSIAVYSQSTPNKKITQPVLGHRSAAILTVNGLQFKDLNRNGKLDTYEDWRLSNDERTKDLLSKMSLEDKVGFMLISTSRLKSERSAQLNVQTDNNIPPSSNLNIFILFTINIY